MKLCLSIIGATILGLPFRRTVVLYASLIVPFFLGASAESRTVTFSAVTTYQDTGYVSGNSLGQFNDILYDIEVPSGWVAKVSVKKYGKGFGIANCDHGGFKQTVDGKNADLFDKTTELLSDSKICFMARPYGASVAYADIYIDRYMHMVVPTPHYAHRYVYYSFYYSCYEYQITVCYEQLLPDLAVVGLSLSEPVAAVDEKVDLSYQVKNVGRKTATATTAVLRDGTVTLSSESIPSLASGRAHAVTLTLPKLSATRHALSVSVESVSEETVVGNNTSSVTLRRYEREPVSVCFDANGGVGGLTRDIIAGERIGEFPSVMHYGYDLTGWTSDIEGNASASAETKITEPSTFYAQWEPVVSEVALNRQGGSGGDVVVTNTYDGWACNVDVPARVGYVFDGYWTELNGFGTQYYSELGIRTRCWDIAYREVVLYAQWLPISTDVIFDNQGGDGGESLRSFNFEQVLPSVARPVREGWTFQGYYSSPNGQGLQYYDEDGNGSRIWDILTTNGTTTLYADWLPCKMDYAVMLDEQCGRLETESVMAVYRNKMPDIDPPVRDRYVFNGYFADRSCSGTMYYDAEGRGLVNWTNATDGIRLYAKWTKAYHVLLDANDGSGRVEDEYFEHSDWILAETPFERAGFVLAGWSTTSNGIPIFANGATVNKLLLGYGDDPDATPVRLYAMWGKRIVAESLNGTEFITGGEGLDPYWREENNVLCTGSSAGNSWLVREYDRRTDVAWTCELRETKYGVDARFVMAGLESVPTNSLYAETTSRSDTVQGGRSILCWCFHQELPQSLLQQSANGYDGRALSELRTRKNESLSDKKEELCDYLRERFWECHAKSDVLKWIDVIYGEYEENIQSINVFKETMLNVFANRAGYDVGTLRLAIQNHSTVGDHVIGLLQNGCDLIDDIDYLNTFIDGRMRLTALTERSCCLIGFVMEDDTAYEMALSASNAIVRTNIEKNRSLNALISKIGYLLEIDNTLNSSRRRDVDQIVRAVAAEYSDGTCAASNGPDRICDRLSNSSSGGFNIKSLRDAIQNRSNSGQEIVEAWNLVVGQLDLIRNYENQIIRYGVLQWRVLAAESKIGVLPTPVMDGYVFDGWWTAKDGGDLVTKDSVFSADAIVYAHWRVPTCLISFDANGGDGGITRVISVGDRLEALPVPLREGFTFAGWYDVANDSQAASILDMPDSDMTYRAEWTKGAAIPESPIYDAVTFDLSLSTGWNWVSLNIVPTNATIGAVFADVAFADEDVVKSADGVATYAGGTWYGELTTIKPGVMYMVKKSTAGMATISVTGSAVATSVDVQAGWNWIGPTATEEITLDVLTHSGGFTDEDVIKSADSFATYLGGKWYGELKSLKPGVGYKAKFAKDGMLKFKN